MLEVCVFNIDSAIKAEAAGADRLELCADYACGGITPSAGIIKQIKNHVSIPVFVMIRPRSGHFVYTTTEVNAMQYDIEYCYNAGVDGVVLGCLQPNGAINIQQTTQLVKAANGLPVTFHRAFDRCNNATVGLQQIIDSGCSRVLTSGLHPTVMEGKETLKQLVLQASNNITILVGSGLNSHNAQYIKQYTQAKEFHTSAKKILNDSNIYNNIDMKEVQLKEDIDEVEIKAIQQALSL